MGCSLVVTWKEQVAKWKSTCTHLWACEHAHQLQVCNAILSLLWTLWVFYQFDLQSPCSVICDPSCYHNKLLSPRIWKCSTPTGGWWYTGSWNSTVGVCVWMSGVGQRVDVMVPTLFFLKSMCQVQNIPSEHMCRMFFCPYNNDAIKIRERSLS